MMGNRLTASLAAVVLGLVFGRIAFAADCRPTPVSPADANRPEIKLALGSPAEGRTYEGRISCSGTVTGVTGNQSVTVRIAGFGVVHHLILDGKQDRNPYEPGLQFNDYFLPRAPGEKELIVSVFFGNNGTPVDEKKVRFHVKPLSPKAADERLLQVHSCLRGATKGPVAECTYAAYRHLAARNKDAHDKLTAQADAVYYARVSDLRDRIQAYCKLSQCHEDRFDLERALGALNLARKIWETEAGKLNHPQHGKVGVLFGTQLVFAPAYFDGLSNFYARCGHLDKAASWMEAKAGWYLKQHAGHATLPSRDKARCLSYAASAYSWIGRLHILLNNDAASKARWEAKAEEFRRRAKTSAG